MTDQAGGQITETIPVSGMSCTHCEQSIVKGLSAMAGVQNVHADHKSGQVAITYAPSQVSRESLEKTLTDLGYPPAG